MVARANIRVSSDPNAVLPTKEELLARTKADKEAARIDARERQKEEFIEKVLAARRPEVKPIVKQPVAPAISEQTAREMAAGAKRSAEFAAAETSRPQRKPDPTQGTTTSVFRPVDGSGVQDRKPSHTWGRRTY
jgi:hypothetical protein